MAVARQQSYNNNNDLMVKSTYQQSFLYLAQAPPSHMDSRNTTSTGFMPGSKPNKYMKQLKKKQATASQSSSSYKRDVQTAEDKLNRRQKMRKFTKNTGALPSGYQAMMAMNGGETLGERDRAEIDEYIGLKNEMKSGDGGSVTDKDQNEKKQ